MSSTYLEKGELPPPGHCLFVSCDDTAPQRRRRRSATSIITVAPPLTPLLICQGDHVWICKASNALQSSGVLIWKHQVQILPTELDMDTAEVLEELLLDLTILPVFTFVNGEEKRNECSALLISIDELEGDDVGANFVATFEDPPDIPLSVAFRRTSAFTQAASPLQLSCWKRQMVGMYVLYGEGLLTTTMSIVDESDGTTLKLCIDSVCLRPSSGLSRENSAANILLITPSTRITILEAEASLPSLITEEATKISDVTDLLLGTIRTMANKHYNIPRIFLLSGPPGAGKTYAVKMALQLAQPARVYTKFLQGSDIMASSSTENVTPGAVIERHFAQLKRKSSEDGTVCLVFLDECDSLMASPTAVAMLGFQLDELAMADCYTRIIVVAATNNIEAVPQDLKRPGRFEQLLVLAPPSLSQRLEILQNLLGEEATCGLEEIAETTIGFVPADLQALVRRARLLGLNSGGHHSLDVNLRKAMVHVGASALRDSALTAPPKANWDSIAGDAGGAKSALIQAIEWPRTKKKQFQLLGLAPPRGILLHGPPGCAKTTLARAAAGSESVSFLSLSPADVFSSSYVGEAEAKIRKAFDNARAAAPCVLFFDEIDAIVGSNTGGGAHNMNRSGGGASAESRVLSTFLNETDGLTTSKGDRVLVIGATNRPSTLDAALLRPGRFDKVIYVPPPDFDGRLAFIKSLLQQMGTLQDIHETDLHQLASDEVSGKMTGAEISGAVREAASRFLRESLSEGNTSNLKAQDLEKALLDVKPLLMDDKILEEYAAFERSRKFH